MSEWIDCPKCGEYHENQCDCVDPSVKQPEEEKIMSDTPRTDAEIERTTKFVESNGMTITPRSVASDFARTLERELNELKETQKRMILEAFPTTEEKVRWEQLIQDRDQLKAELNEMKRKYGFTYCAFCGATYEIDAPESVNLIAGHIATCVKHPMRAAEKERDQLKAEVERCNCVILQSTIDRQDMKREANEAACEVETLKAQVSELINQRNQLLKKKPNICPNCKEEVKFWADHIHSLPNQSTSYFCFSSQQWYDMARELGGKLAKHHKHHSEPCTVYFEQDGKPIDVLTDLGDAYQDSALAEETGDSLARFNAMEKQP